MLDRYKLAYSVYNFFQKNKLEHNLPVYKKLGLNKKYYSPVSSEDFKNLKIDENKILKKTIGIKQTTIFKNLDTNQQEHLLEYDENGYIILKNFLTPEKVNAINEEVDKLLKEKKVKFEYGNKIMFAIHQSTLLRSIANDENLIELLKSLLGDNVKLFQSINFLSGSQQKSHSDSIHMTTFPLGGLLGVWIALEDIEKENGALHYYPGSHKLPYYLNADYDNVGDKFRLGKNDYHAYEKMLEEKIKEHKLEKKIFNTNAGDLLIWHANLIHGGEAHTNKNRTRKSMVFHYYNTDCVCYHEITQRPALIKK